MKPPVARKLKSWMREEVGEEVENEMAMKEIVVNY
jgi:hypothetical protein